MYTQEQREWLKRTWDFLESGRKLLMKPKPWWVRLFCNHKLEHWLQNIYGDEIMSSGHRSRWQCTKCGTIKTRPELMTDLEKEEIGKNPFHTDQ